jgi:hypothetical protein
MIQTISQLDDRLRQVERDQAVSAEILKRIEQDLSSIAATTEDIKGVVKGWKGGLVVILMIAGGLMTIIAGVFDNLWNRIMGGP